MIRLLPFGTIAYESLRNEYMNQLISNNIVMFDEADLLGNGNNEPGKRTKRAHELLMSSSRKIDNYLFDENGNVRRENLRLLLIGPDKMPQSFGGNGNIPTMRSVFEGIIRGLWTIRDKTERRAIESVFNYSAMNKSTDDKENMAYWLMNMLKTETCPFCNRLYTKTLFPDKDGAKIRPEFDHFYPKSKYPYFSVSLFNLIPICSYCNKLKLNHAESFTKDKYARKSIIYPYDEAFDHNDGKWRASFRVIPGDEKYGKSDYFKTMIGKSTDFSVEIQPTHHGNGIRFQNPCGVFLRTAPRERFKVKTVNDDKDSFEEAAFWKRIGTSVQCLNLEKLYNTHKEEIALLLRNHYQYNKSGIKLILSTYIKNRHFDLDDKKLDLLVKELDLLVKEMMYFAFLKQEDWGKSPLNKLKHDILEQLDEFDDLIDDDGGNISE